MALTSRIALRLATLLVAALVIGLPATASAASPARKAKRSVKKRLVKRYDKVERVKCRAVGRARRGHRRARARRVRCSWRAHRRPTPNRLTRCRGRYRVTVRGRRVRLRARGRRRCRSKISTLAPWLGFNDNSVRAGQLSATESARLTESVGAGITRVGFDWRHAEPSPGHFVLKDYDDIYRASLARGIRPLFILGFAPPWARDPLALCPSDCRYPPNRAHYGNWRRIAALIAQRYPRAAGIEIWNEPNEREFWSAGPSPTDYTALLREAHVAIKRANPSMRVVSGGFSNRGANEGPNIGLAEFLQGIYSRGGRGSFDVLGFHAYPESPRLEALAHTLQAVLGIPPRYGDGAIPKWATELGLSTTDPDPRYRVTPQAQASGVLATVRALRARGIKMVLVHTLVDGSTGGREAGYGAFRRDGTPKPAACALARAAGVRRPPRGCG